MSSWAFQHFCDYKASQDVNQTTSQKIYTVNADQELVNRPIPIQFRVVPRHHSRGAPLESRALHRQRLGRARRTAAPRAVDGEGSAAAAMGQRGDQQSIRTAIKSLFRGRME